MGAVFLVGLAGCVAGSRLPTSSSGSRRSGIHILIFACIACSPCQLTSAVQRASGQPDQVGLSWRSHSGSWAYGKGGLHQPRTLLRWEGEKVMLECTLPPKLKDRHEAVVWSRQNRPLRESNIPQKAHIDGATFTITDLTVKNSSVYRCELALGYYRARTFYIEFRLTVFARPVFPEKAPILLSVEPLAQVLQEEAPCEPFRCDVTSDQPSLIQWVKVTSRDLLPVTSADDPSLIELMYEDSLETTYQWEVHTTSWSIPSRSPNAKTVERDLDINDVRWREAGLYACVVSHPYKVQLRLVNLTVVGGQSVPDLLPRPRSLEDYWSESLFPGTLGPWSEPGSLESEIDGGLPPSAITYTGFFSVITIFILMAVCCALLAVLAVATIIRSERVYPGQKLELRSKRKAIDGSVDPHPEADVCFEEIYRPVKKTPRNGLARSVAILPVCESGFGFYEMKRPKSESWLSYLLLSAHPAKARVRRMGWEAVEDVGTKGDCTHRDLDHVLDLDEADALSPGKAQVLVHQPEPSFTSASRSRSVSESSIVDRPTRPELERESTFPQRSNSYPNVSHSFQTDAFIVTSHKSEELVMSVCLDILKVSDCPDTPHDSDCPDMPPDSVCPDTPHDSDCPDTHHDSNCPDMPPDSDCPDTPHDSVYGDTHHDSVCPDTHHDSVCPDTHHDSDCPDTHHDSVCPDTHHDSVCPDTPHDSVCPHSYEESVVYICPDGCEGKVKQTFPDIRPMSFDVHMV